MTTTTLNVRDLRVWDAACILALQVRRASTAGAGGEGGDLWRQARRAADSVGANIAEGSGRPTVADRRRFFAIAMGSLRETQHHLRMCRDYDLLTDRDYQRLAGLASVTRRMLDALTKRMR
jgi:four helix bundle protein